MNYKKLNTFNDYCKTLSDYSITKPSQIIIIYKSYKWKLFWIGCIIGDILAKLRGKK
jgi:hypothetical protein